MTLRRLFVAEPPRPASGAPYQVCNVSRYVSAFFVMIARIWRMLRFTPSPRKNIMQTLQHPNPVGRGGGPRWCAFRSLFVTFVAVSPDRYYPMFAMPVCWIMLWVPLVVRFFSLYGILNMRSSRCSKFSPLKQQIFPKQRNLSSSLTSNPRLANIRRRSFLFCLLPLFLRLYLSL